VRIAIIFCFYYNVCILCLCISSLFSSDCVLLLENSSTIIRRIYALNSNWDISHKPSIHIFHFISFIRLCVCANSVSHHNSCVKCILNNNTDFLEVGRTKELSYLQEVYMHITISILWGVCSCKQVGIYSHIVIGRWKRWSLNWLMFGSSDKYANEWLMGRRGK